MEFLYVPFSLLMKGCLFISNNHYIFALFFFALFMEIILIPFAIKQQKSQIKMAEVRPKEMAIREKYKGRNDKATQQKMTMEIQEMYQQNGYNQFAGCLPLLIRLPIILILFAIVRQPMSYATDLKKDGFDIDKNAENAVVFYQDVKDSLNSDNEDYGKYLEQIEEYQTQLGVTSVKKDKDTDKPTNLPSENTKTFKVNGTEVFASADKGTYKEMALSRLISYGEEDLLKLKESGIIKEDKYNEIVKKYGELGYTQEIKDKLPEYRIGPVNLIEQPSLKGDYWLLLIPLLVFLTSFLSTKLTRKFSASAQQTDANGNPIGGGLFM
ncbi:MAG: YidC/Oxa1 family membrane protein insertase, partial [Clostridia bacterium]|nr:YidC/Oxa1 family membrane protein insertase [Clostridia bacterium]